MAPTMREVIARVCQMGDHVTRRNRGMAMYVIGHTRRRERTIVCKQDHSSITARHARRACRTTPCLVGAQQGQRCSLVLPGPNEQSKSPVYRWPQMCYDRVSPQRSDSTLG